MNLTYKFQIDKNKTLLDFCKTSKDLYNQANYLIKNYYLENNKYLGYYEFEKIIKHTTNLENEINYRKLKAQVSQQTLMLLDKNWKSYFRSIKDYKKNPGKYKGLPKPPGYLPKDGKNILIYTYQSAKIKNNVLKLSQEFSINIPEYKGRTFDNFRQVRILPFQDYLEVEIVYEHSIPKVELNEKKYAGIDLGVANLATFVSEDNVYIFNGNPLKSINQFYNKQKSTLQSLAETLNGRKSTNKIRRITHNRNNKIKDYLHKTSKMIVDICLKNKIGTLFVGYNNDWKDSIKLGKTNNQNFVSIPHKSLLNMLKYKCELYGICFESREESYTSKCDGLAYEELKHHEIYLGNRKHRGLFQSSIGKVINADVNGSFNIIRKKVVDNSYLQNEIVNRGLLFNPVKVNPLINKII
jgi:putative transposase